MITTPTSSSATSSPAIAVSSRTLASAARMTPAPRPRARRTRARSAVAAPTGTRHSTITTTSRTPTFVASYGTFVDKVPLTIVATCDNHSTGVDSGNTLHASASEQRSLIRQWVLILHAEGIRAPCVHINRQHTSIKAGDDLSRALVEDFKTKLRSLFDDSHLTFERVNIPSSLRHGLLDARNATWHTAQLRASLERGYRPKPPPTTVRARALSRARAELIL